MSSDYCTFFWEGNWSDCCWQHDSDCLLALEYLSYTKRLNADIKLFKCVYKKNKFMACVMYFGVTVWANTFWWTEYWREKRSQK
jgi:hypothetical protein